MGQLGKDDGGLEGQATGEPYEAFVVTEERHEVFVASEKCSSYYSPSPAPSPPTPSPNEAFVASEKCSSYSSPSPSPSPPTPSPILAWLSMFATILTGASIGPCFKYLQNHGVTARLASSWRNQVMLIFLIPMHIIERRSTAPAERINLFSRKPELPYPVIIHVLIAGSAWAANLLLWVSGIRYTSTVRANIFACLYPLMLVVLLQVRPTAQGQGSSKPSKFEWLGTFIALSGVVIISVKNLAFLSFSALDSGGALSNSEIIGDSLCTCAAMAEVLVILNRHQTKRFVPLWEYTTITTVVVIVVSSVCAVVIDDARVFCLDDDCLFGWISHRWIKLIVAFGAIVGLICMPALNYAIQYIPPLLFSCATLLDPIFTGLISWAVGLEGVPTAHTWIGGLVVIAGSACISYGETRRKISGHDCREGFGAEERTGEERGEDVEMVTPGLSSAFTYLKLSKEETEDPET